MAVVVLLEEVEHEVADLGVVVDVGAVVGIGDDVHLAFQKVYLNSKWNCFVVSHCQM